MSGRFPDAGANKKLRSVSRSVFEIAFQKAGESGAVTGFVLGHFVHGVMNGVEPELLRLFGDLELAGAGALFGFHALGQVGLRAKKKTLDDVFLELT